MSGTPLLMDPITQTSPFLAKVIFKWRFMLIHGRQQEAEHGKTKKRSTFRKVAPAYVSLTSRIGVCEDALAKDPMVLNKTAR